jgi:hypothetical protein
MNTAAVSYRPALDAARRAAAGLAEAEGHLAAGDPLAAASALSDIIPALLDTIQAVADDTDDPPGQLVELRKPLSQWSLRLDLLLLVSREQDVRPLHMVDGISANIERGPLNLLREILVAWADGALCASGPRPPSADLYGQTLDRCGMGCTLTPPPVSPDEARDTLRVLRQAPATEAADWSGLTPQPHLRVVPFRGSDDRIRLYLVDVNGRAQQV